MDTAKNVDDIYEFKSVKEGVQTQDADIQDNHNETVDSSNVSTVQGDESAGKRNFSDVSEHNDDVSNDEESRRKKRKDENSGKDGKTISQRNTAQGKGQATKQNVSVQNKQTVVGTTKTNLEKKSPCSSPKPTSSTSDVEIESDQTKSDLKVPPLKIVIPQSANTEQESGTTRNGKNSSQRSHQALPYVVASNSNSSSSDSTEKEVMSGNAASPDASKSEEKKDGGTVANQTEEGRGSSHQRVLRSSHRSGPAGAGTDRGSNNSSPQLQQSHSPSPSASPAAPSGVVQNNDTTSAAGTQVTTSKASDSVVSDNIFYVVMANHNSAII